MLRIHWERSPPGMRVDAGCGGREELVGDALHGVAVNDVAHLVAHHAGDLVFVEVAELEQRAGQVDEAAGQREGAGLVCLDRRDSPAALLVGEPLAEAPAGLGEEFATSGVVVERGSAVEGPGQVAAGLVFGLERLAFTPGERGPDPAALAGAGAQLATELEEEVLQERASEFP